MFVSDSPAMRSSFACLRDVAVGSVGGIEEICMILSRRVTATLILPAVLAIGLIAAAEGAIALALRPTFMEKSTWLLHDPYDDEQFDRLIVYEKLKLLEADADIISVGDSSGFFSIQPTIVNRYTNGLRYLNFSTGGNQTFDGFKGIAEYSLQRSKRIKHVLLHILPFRAPEAGLLTVNAQGRTLHDDLVGLRSYLTPRRAVALREAQAARGPDLRSTVVEPQDLCRDAGHVPAHARLGA